MTDFIQALIRLMLLIGTLVVSTVQGKAEPAAEWSEGQYLFGVINDDGDHYADEWARGVRATTFELHWSIYEPQEGVYNTAYVAGMQQRLAELRSQGWYVQLVPGYQYVPAWVFSNYPNVRFVNQFGEAYDPPPGSMRVINAPFNPMARQLIAGYLARVFTDFEPSSFDSVRVGGLVQGELRYPPPDWNGHPNSYWAFDVYAQNPAVSGIPPFVQGWRPGVDPNPGSVGRGQLIANKGFEEQHPYFPIAGWAIEDEVTATVVPGTGPDASKALKINISTPHRVYQFVRVEPSTIYDFGTWLRSGDGSGRARLFVEQYDMAGNSLSDEPFGLVESSSVDWQAHTGEIATATSTSYLRISMDGHQAGEYYFDDVWLKARDAPNDQNRDLVVPTAFYDWYVQKLTDYQNWQIGEIRQYYTGPLDVLYPGKGLQSNQVIDALTNDLRGDSWRERSSALYSGAVYARHAAGLPMTPELRLYLTGIEEPPASAIDDNSPYPSRWSAAKWLAHLANENDVAVWGENGGQDSREQMQLSLQRMASNKFLGLMWAFESELYAEPNQGYASIADYEGYIRVYNSNVKLFLPVTAGGG